MNLFRLILLKNISLFSVAGIMFYMVGYNLMYMNVDGGFFGTLMPWTASDSTTNIAAGGYASASDWFFQMVFVATTASIVSGAVAERVKVWPFLFFIIGLTAFIYPIVGSWHWGAGWLSEMGFVDFAGSTIVHSVGGWAALMGVLFIGPRIGKYREDGTLSVNMLPSNLPLVTLGVFILWMGWFGFNGGSQLALGTAADAVSMANIFVNTTLAAAAGVVIVMVSNEILYKKIDLTLVLNGALAGLVAITAGPDTASPLLAIMIGAVGGLLATIAVPLLNKLKIDDVVGAIPVHLVAGIWGTMAVPLSNPSASFLVQGVGVLSIAAFVVITSAILWYTLKVVFGIRIDQATELKGIDITELAGPAYPEFNKTDV